MDFIDISSGNDNVGESSVRSHKIHLKAVSQEKTLKVSILDMIEEKSS